MSFEASRLKQLVETARDRSPEARCALLRDITDVFMAQPDSYNPAERRLFDVILCRLAGEAALALRRELAERFADASTAPKALVTQLAHDDICVAEPVLRRSTALGEQDLIAIIKQGGQHDRRNQAQMSAIAKRRNLTPAISHALAIYGEEDALVSLAKNQSARFTPDAMGVMTIKAGKITALQDPMVNRYDLPPQHLTRIYFYVPATLKKEILKRADMLDPELVQLAITANRQKTLDEAMEKTGGEASDGRYLLLEKMKSGAVNEQFLQSLITKNRQAEFLIAFAHLTGVDLTNTRILLRDATYEAHAIACRAAGLERQTFTKIVFSFCKTEKDKAKALRILDLYAKTPIEAAERIMRFWRMRTDAATEAGYAPRHAGDEPSTAFRRVEG